MQIPQNSSSDAAYAVAKGAISSVPIVGSAASELFSLLITPPLEKRRNKWMEYISEKIHELEKIGIHSKDLSTNEEFISTVLEASTIALKTHSKSKHEHLRNTLLNVEKEMGHHMQCRLFI